MSVQTKKRFKNLGKTIGIALFALLMFTNIKVALMDDAELASGDISVFGIELNLFVPSYAETTETGCTVVWGPQMICIGCQIEQGAWTGICCKWTCGDAVRYLCGPCY